MPHRIAHELFAHIPECHGYVPLSIAFAQFVAVKCDDDPFDQEQLTISLRESTCAQEVLRWFIRLLQSGEFRSVSRPIGGGPTANMSGSHWQADDVTQRFVTSQYSRISPFNAEAESDSWIFLHDDDFDRIWEEHRHDTLGDLIKPRRSPRRRAESDEAKGSPGDSPLIGLGAVEDLIGLGRSTIYKMMQEKRFPARIKIGERSLWRRQEITDWIEAIGKSSRSPPN